MEREPNRVATPNGHLCASWCPQRDGNTGLGRCRLLGYHVRADMDEEEASRMRRLGCLPIPAELCPVLAIRGAMFSTGLPPDSVYRLDTDGTKTAIRCSLCGGFVERPADRDVLRCMKCGAEAPVVCTTGFDRDWKRHPYVQTAPDVTPWACLFSRLIRDDDSRKGSKVSRIFVNGNDITVRYAREAAGYCLDYPTVNPPAEWVAAAAETLGKVLRQHRLMD